MLGYITVGNSGATTLTFNATSIQNAIILGLFILVLGALVLPLFGISMGETEETGYGYGYEQPAYAYEESAQGYGYAKRSVDSVGPVLAAMAAAEEKNIKLNKFANFRNTYFQIPTIQIYTSLQQPRHYFFSTQALLDDVCIFSQNSPLKPLLLSITLLLATMLLLPVCAKILSKYLAALPLKRHQNLLLYSN